MGDEDDFLNNLLFQVGCDVQDMAVQYSAVQCSAVQTYHPLGCTQCHDLQAWTHHGRRVRLPQQPALPGERYWAGQ
jgi:hypothetical protein